MGDRRQLSELASRQAGAFNIRQARMAGFSSSAVHHRLRTGEWVRLDDSVCAVAATPDCWHLRLWAAVLSREEALVTHMPALALLGLPGASRAPAMILTPRHANTRSAIARVFESDQFDRIGSTQVDGLPVTTMPETLLVMARDRSPSEIASAFDQALISGLLDLGAMSRVIDREAGRRTPGIPLLRQLVSTRRPGAPSKNASYLERLLERLLSDERVPPWRREVPLLLGGRTSRVDVFIEKAQLVVEADGRNWHARQEDFEADRARDNALAARGIQVLRFSYRMLEQEPDRCLEQVVATCLLRAA